MIELIHNSRFVDVFFGGEYGFVPVGLVQNLRTKLCCMASGK